MIRMPQGTKKTRNKNRPNTLYSYDIFDTLIARKCIHPHNIFLEIEKKYNIFRFSKVRILADQRAWQKTQGNFSIDDIYIELANITGLPRDIANQIKAEEIRLEKENIIPIQKNIDHLKEGSILITDMYFDEQIIRDFLLQANIKQPAIILQTNGGKSTGLLWEEIKELGTTCIHQGDNPTSDVKNAVRQGMTAFHCQLSQPTFFERLLLKTNCINAARELRQGRLATHHSFQNKSRESLITQLQDNINVPTLLYFAAKIIQQTKQHSRPGQKVLFSSRGSNLLYHAFTNLSERHHTKKMESSYWLSSRDARFHGDNDYLDYTKQLATDDALFIDLNGSGFSLRYFLNRISHHNPRASYQAMLCYGYLNSEEYINHAYKRSDQNAISGGIESILHFNHFPLDILHLESLNFSPEGLLLDMKSCRGGYLPIRDAYEYCDELLTAVEDQASYTKQVLDWMRNLSTEAFNELTTSSFLKCVEISWKFHKRRLEEFFDAFKRDHALHEASHIKRFASKTISEQFVNNRC